LEQHRDAGHQQEISGHRAKPARARQRVTALSGAGIGDLIMVLQKDDKTFRREVEGWGAARVPATDQIVGVSIAAAAGAVQEGCQCLKTMPS
jgi:hypothetical protein